MKQAIVLTGMFLLAPLFLGALSGGAPTLVAPTFEACAAEEEGGGSNGSCCPKNAICGLNGQNFPGHHFVDGSCPDDNDDG